MHRIAFGALLLALAACRPEPTDHPEPVDDTALPENDGAQLDGDDGAAAGSECVSLVEEAVANDAYAKGKAKLEEAQDGEHYLAEPFGEALGALKSAAEGGHRTAQSVYGRRLFDSLFMAEAPKDEQRGEYVDALTFMRVAALRGDEDVLGYLPGLPDAFLTDTPPLDSVPAAWVEEAMERSTAWMECHGEEAGDRGAEP